MEFRGRVFWQQRSVFSLRELRERTNSVKASALTHGQAAPLLTVPENLHLPSLMHRFSAHSEWHENLRRWHSCLKRKVLVCEQGMQHRKLVCVQRSTCLLFQK
ncbi:hypothetical protein V5799_007247 [Amblyomma americanum]|uniref:Uncharacterized protein n=1 Tax=Amblyomma americanum TaxID=6943 RepID=A0AAQ4DU32_AMBAM